MKIRITSVLVVLAIGALSCSQPQEAITPNSSARQGSGSSTPSPTGTLPVLPPAANPIYNLGPVMPAGTWTVKSYVRALTDKTSDYKGYTFVFSPNNILTVTDNKGVATSGRWFAYVGGQVPYYGAAPAVTALGMSFDKSASSTINRLGATWNVNMATTTTDVILDNVEPLSGERIEFSL